MRTSRLRYFANTLVRFSSWVCLGSLNRSSPMLDDSPRTYQTALPQPFVAFLSPLTYQRLFRIRCGVATSILTESFDGVSIQFVSPTRKRSSTRFSLRGSHQVVSELRLFLFGLSIWVFFFVLRQFRVKKKKSVSWVLLVFCSSGLGLLISVWDSLHSFRVCVRVRVQVNQVWDLGFRVTNLGVFVYCV